MRITRSLVLGVVLVSTPFATASAESWAPGALPNGFQNSCSNCHNSSRGGGARNVFGQFVQSSGAYDRRARTIDFSLLFDTDSDGDGYTNGEELGDPEGDGTTIPGWDATLPGNIGDIPCGNGTVEGPEVCDGSDLDGASCTSLGEPDGILGCSSSCEYNVELCGFADVDAGFVDAGADDAGADAAGADDAGESIDSSSEDAGGASADASTGADTTIDDPGTTTSNSDEGGCSAAKGSSPFGLLVAMVALAVTLPSRRRSLRG
jgi:hypothetical protein